MCEFIEQAIDSVLSQDYPHIEYLVLDGGSTDGTLEVLERYRDRLRYYSGPDAGTADAINRGVAMSRGSIVAWLNADDIYLPGAVSCAVAAFREHPDAGVVYGEGLWLDASGEIIGEYPVRDADQQTLAAECCICQPASFIRRETWERVGGLDTTLATSFDYEFWIRMTRFYPMVRIPVKLAGSRLHRGGKTLRQRNLVYADAFRVLKKHYGYVPFAWVYAQLRFLLRGREDLPGAMKPSIPAFLWSLPAGLWHNPRHAPKFFGEWLRASRLFRW